MNIEGLLYQIAVIPRKAKLQLNFSKL